MEQNNKVAGAEPKLGTRAKFLLQRQAEQSTAAPQAQPQSRCNVLREYQVAANQESPADGADALQCCAVLWSTCHAVPLRTRPDHAQGTPPCHALFNLPCTLQIAMRSPRCHALLSHVLLCAISFNIHTAMLCRRTRSRPVHKRRSRRTMKVLH